MILIQRPAFAGFDRLYRPPVPPLSSRPLVADFFPSHDPECPPRHYIPASAHPLRRSLRRLAPHSGNPPVSPGVSFSGSYFFYIDGVDTIIRMATAYGVDIGMTTTQLLTIILVIQILAFPFALLYGKLADVWEQSHALCGHGSLRNHRPDCLRPSFNATAQIRTLFYWILAVLVASSQGGIRPSAFLFRPSHPQRKIG
jgi:UMF1 family MFS transporter